MNTKERKRIKMRVRKLMNSIFSNRAKRRALNLIEKHNPQDVFIKTHLCECGRLNAEVWFKSMSVESKEK